MGRAGDKGAGFGVDAGFGVGSGPGFAFGFGVDFGSGLTSRNACKAALARFDVDSASDTSLVLLGLGVVV